MENNTVAVQLQHSSLQSHQHSSQWQDDVVHVCAHSEEQAAIATLESKTAPHHMAPPDVLTGRSVHARLRREVPVDHEAQRQAAMAAAESRSAAAELCSNKLRRDGHPQAEAGRRLPQEVVLISSADHKEHVSQLVLATGQGAGPRMRRDEQPSEDEQWCWGFPDHAQQWVAVW